MKSFSRFDGITNISGFWQHFFIEDSRIKKIPVDINGVIDLNGIEYTNPADTNWYAGASVQKTLMLGNDMKQTTAGPSYPVKIEGVAAKKDAYNTKLFHEKSFQRFICLVNDYNGNTILCGEPGNGLLFEWKDIPGGLSFAYSAAYKAPCWFCSGSIYVDGIVNGAAYVPGATYELGDKGERGTMFHFGVPAPGAGLGLNDDFYFRDDGTLYQKTAGAWVAVGSVPLLRDEIELVFSQNGMRQ